VLYRIVTTLMVWHGILHMGGVWVCLFRFTHLYDDYFSWVACSVFVCVGVGFHRVVDYYCFFFSHARLFIVACSGVDIGGTCVLYDAHSAMV